MEDLDTPPMDDVESYKSAANVTGTTTMAITPCN